ncbi:hypothetical protein Rsub_03673 [Raphidocelis subcapitata]|uniref:Uncharacterized protein n=1 Tax=Raphidocelis subcapitata TaxID=307507 RepID=A0A2V0NU23_9CHLO|nr:hypothetical protein Rsub_03673 [Raphidocelis subcapitata]|eukprot:GBF90819.1 hypothetical protein Rsub_03673 [Raphidocelis subcapitata]
MASAVAQNNDRGGSGGGGGSSGGAPGPGAALRASRSMDRQPRQLWLDAWADPVAGVNALTPCVHTCNLMGDGDWRLVVADADRKLKVWKGTARASEHELLEAPVAVTSCAPPDSEPPPRLPVLAVAAGCHVYMFRGLRPHYKFAVPPLPAGEEEARTWEQLDAGTLNPAAGAAALSALRDAGAPLSDRAAGLLAAAAARGDAGAAGYAAATRGQALGRQTVITCMETLKLASDEPEAASCLLLGCEDGRVLVLDAAGTGVHSTLSLGAPPALLSASGTLAGGYRLSVAARDGRLHTFRPGEGGGTAVVQLEAQAVGLVRIGQVALVGTMAEAVHAYGGRSGTARLYSLPQPAAVQAMAALAAAGPRPAKCLVVALANGEVRVYNERCLVSTHTTPSRAPVAALACGRYAREDNALVAVLRGGGLDIKILPRTANLEASAAPGGPPPEQDVPLPVPAKTRLYVEQTQRERDGAVDMHRTYQRDIGAASRAAGAELSLSAAVEGLGPRFRLVLRVVNEGAAAVGGLVVVVHCDPELSSRQQLPLPLLVPLLEYTLAFDLRSLQPDAGAGEVRLSVVARGGGAPLMRALVRMPLSEPEEL